MKYQYREINTNEIVEDFMAEDYVLDRLGIKGERSIEADKITVTTDNSNLYSNWYSLLENSDLVDLDPEETLMDFDETRLVYISDDYRITILGDLENNVYKLEIEEL